MSNASGSLRGAILGTAVLLGSVSAPVVAENPGGWEYSVAPMYLWAKNIDGTSTVGGMEAPLSLEFADDILENLEAAFAIHAEAKQGPLTLFAEYNYAKLDPSTDAQFGPFAVTVDINFRDVMGEFGVAYAFSDSGSTRWEVLGGVRYFDQKIDVNIDKPDIAPGVLPIPDEISGGDDWWHGFGGFRVTRKLSERWSFLARADYGYQDSDNKTLQATGIFDYRFRSWGSFFVGYRFMDTTYDNGELGLDNYGFDADQQGPALGLNLRF
ncbi:MAG: hypothetical protein V7709_13810 [Halioglobus sp.]